MLYTTDLVCSRFSPRHLTPLYSFMNKSLFTTSSLKLISKYYCSLYHHCCRCLQYRAIRRTHNKQHRSTHQYAPLPILLFLLLLQYYCITISTTTTSSGGGGGGGTYSKYSTSTTSTSSRREDGGGTAFVRIGPLPSFCDTFLIWWTPSKNEPSFSRNPKKWKRYFFNGFYPKFPPNL